RPTQRAAELAALETVVKALAVGPDRRKRARRIEPVVAEEFERVAREAVRARLRHGVHARRRMDAILRGEATRRDAELLERVRERQREVDVFLRVVVRRPVEG